MTLCRRPVEDPGIETAPLPARPRVRAEAIAAIATATVAARPTWSESNVKTCKPSAAPSARDRRAACRTPKL